MFIIMSCSCSCLIYDLDFNFNFNFDLNWIWLILLLFLNYGYGPRLEFRFVKKIKLRACWAKSSARFLSCARSSAISAQDVNLCRTSSSVPPRFSSVPPQRTEDFESNSTDGVHVRTFEQGAVRTGFFWLLHAHPRRRFLSLTELVVAPSPPTASRGPAAVFAIVRHAAVIPIGSTPSEEHFQLFTK